MKMDLSILWGDAGILLLQGFVVTVELSVICLVASLLIGFVVGVLRWFGIRLLAPIIWLYVEFCRNTPPVVQILFWYFSAPLVLPRGVFMVLREAGLPFGATAIALSIYHGAFFAEVIRAGLRSVGQGQVEAARVLGLPPRHSLMRVILPQAIRVAIPSLVNEATSLIKNTSLAMAVGVAEMTFQYRQIDNFMFRGIEALTAITVLYLLICLGSAAIGNLAARHFSRHRRARTLILPAAVVQ